LSFHPSKALGAVGFARISPPFFLLAVLFETLLLG